jgi:hypothetical protein
MATIPISVTPTDLYCKCKLFSNFTCANIMQMINKPEQRTIPLNIKKVNKIVEQVYVLSTVSQLP